MKKIIPALVVFAFLGGASAYADELQPNGSVKLDGQQTNGYPGQDYNNNAITPLANTGVTTMPAANGTVRATGQQTNGYPGQDPNNNGISAQNDMGSGYMAPANGTVRPNGQQTNGYPANPMSQN